jgi:hypothetical protein
MTDADTKRRYHLRLTGKFATYVDSWSQHWNEWTAGSVIEDPAVIELMEARGAPTERIYEGDYRR